MPSTLKEMEERSLTDLIESLAGRDEYFRQQILSRIDAVVRENRRDARRSTLKDVALDLRQRGQSDLARVYDSQANIV